MPKRLLHSVCVQDQAIAADGVSVFDLPVNPLSFILINIRPLNDTGTLANFNRAMGLAGALDRISVLWRGSSIFSMSGRDALALNYFRHGMIPFEANGDDTDNERRCLSLPVLFGRFPYDSRCCLPSTTRGELTLEVTSDIADTGYDGLRLSVESAELVNAEPKEYERKTTIARTFAATGFQDFDLPNGNVLRGLLLFGTTPFGGAAPAPSWGRVELQMDGQQVCYSSADFEVLHQIHQVFGRQPPTGQRHAHRVTTDGNAQAELTTLAGPHGEGLGEGWENYAWMDLDPTRDDEYSLETKNSSSLIIRANVETADACRAVMVERIDL
jgi:hypothetical protein